MSPKIAARARARSRLWCIKGNSPLFVSIHAAHQYGLIQYTTSGHEEIEKNGNNLLRFDYLGTICRVPAGSVPCVMAIAFGYTLWRKASLLRKNLRYRVLLGMANRSDVVMDLLQTLIIAFCVAVHDEGIFPKFFSYMAFIHRPQTPQKSPQCHIGVDSG